MGFRLGLVGLVGLSMSILTVPEAPIASAEEHAAEAPLFVEKTRDLGLDFVHDHYGTGEKYMPENMGPGLAVFDADGDSRLDLFFVQGAPVDGSRKLDGRGHRLYLQTDEGRFEGRNIPMSGAEGEAPVGSGMGVSFGDADRDGDLDLYIAAYGPDLFLRNEGGGRFVPATAEIGLGKSSWSTGSTFFDADADGDLDLYVSSYVDFALDNHKFCGNAAKKLRSYCHPDVYEALPDAFYRNIGGRFEEASRQSGFAHTEDGKGLGVIAGDVDRDGDIDLYVANDSAMNYLYLGQGSDAAGRPRFEESALFAGAGLNGAGAAEASMGVEMGDLDGDGLPELFTTHLDQETNTLYRNQGDGLFADHSEASGLGRPSLPHVGFGTVFFDFDLDGDLDVATVNGHIVDNIHLFSPERRHAQPPQLFRNTEGRFTEVEAAFAPTSVGETAPMLVGRGLVAADLDRDGDPDLVLSENGGPARIYENQARDSKRAGHFLRIHLVGKASNTEGFGARLELKVGKETRVREMRAASSYLSQGPAEVLLGLGKAKKVDELVVRWPSGQVDRHGPLDADSAWRIEEGGKAERLPR